MRTIASLLALSLCTVGAASCAQPQPDPLPFKATYSVLQLMEGPIAHAAEVYWGAVSTIVDEKGITENFPKNDEEWEAVWAAGITLSEAGNLLMMSPRAKDQGDWIKWASAMVDVGASATKAAEDKNADQVLAVGEKVYNVCTQCHMQYIPPE